MATTYPPIYDPSNGAVRKRSAVDAGWQTLTPHKKEARMDDAAYPLTSTFHSMIEHDNEIDTAAVAPIVRTILVHQPVASGELKYARGTVLWLHQATGGCKMHHGYRGLAYWTVCTDKSGHTETQLTQAHPFVMAEPGAIGAGGCATVAVAMADATVMHISRGSATTVAKYDPDVAAKGKRSGRSGDPSAGTVMQGELAAVEMLIGNNWLKPLIVTMLQVHEWDKEVSVCVHTAVDRPIVGLYKYAPR